MTMSQPENKQLGVAGVTAVCGFFVDLGWGPITNDDHDIGTDVWVQLRDDKLVDQALMIGVQVKTGDSFFGTPGELLGRKGYWYAESDQRHANYWANCPVPHIIVLQNSDRSIRIWNYASRTTITHTGKGFKIFVPEDQKLDSSAKELLFSASTKQLKTVPYEGSQWNSLLEEIEENERLMFSLLVPRLVAPHPNKGSVAPIDWFQAVALCVQAQPSRWEHLAKQQSDVLSPADARKSPLWGWRFASAVYAWLCLEDISELENLEKPANASYGIAANIFFALALTEMNRSTEALALLTSEVREGEFSVEQGWLNIQRARIYIEFGQVALGREVAAKAYVQLAQVPASVVVSAVKGAVAWTLFETSNWAERDVSLIATAQDNFSSWWRTQTIAAGLESAVEDHFKVWAQDKSIRFIGESNSHNSIFSSALLARLAGDHGHWKANLGLLAMVDLSIGAFSEKVQLDSLNALRKTGNVAALEKAVRKIRHSGPLSVIADLISDISPAIMTRTSFLADLKIIQLAGEYASDEQAKALVEFLLDSLEKSNLRLSDFSPYGAIEGECVQSLGGLVPFVDLATEGRIIRYFTSFSECPNRLLEQPFNTLAGKLSKESRGAYLEAIEGVAVRMDKESWYYWFLLKLAGKESEIARPLIHEGLLEGLPSALEAIRNPGDFRPEEAEAVLRRCLEGISVYRKESAAGTRGLGGQDWAHTYAVVAYHFPELADWEVLLDFLADHNVSMGRKRDLCKFLADIEASIPINVKNKLKKILPDLLEVPEAESEFLGLIPKIGGAVGALYLLLIGRDHPDCQAILGKLLTGDEFQRLDVVDYLATQSGYEYVLLAMTSDENDKVKNRAAASLAHQVATREALDVPFLECLSSLVNTGGESLVFSVFNGLTSVSPIRDSVKKFLEALQTHSSIQIRQESEKVATKSD